MTTFPTAPPNTMCGTRLKVSASPESQPSSSDAKTQLTDFSWIPQILRARFRCMTSFTNLVLFSIWHFYFDISEWHILPARAWTSALMLHLTNTCANRKVLSLTTPKGKIYKTISLGHYITSTDKINISTIDRIYIYIYFLSVIYNIKQTVSKIDAAHLNDL